MLPKIKPVVKQTQFDAINIAKNNKHAKNSKTDVTKNILETAHKIVYKESGFRTNSHKNSFSYS